jgi:ABC-type bacteriocin/lantibiotic exporter with double-glycine peptidase domain
MKYPIVLQHSEEDCSAACIATIAKHYGLILSISRVRELVGTGQFGTSLLGLKRGVENLGFNARQVKASPELLERIAVPNIARRATPPIVVQLLRGGKNSFTDAVWINSVLFI